MFYDLATKRIKLEANDSITLKRRGKFFHVDSIRNKREPHFANGEVSEMTYKQFLIMVDEIRESEA
jgi:hypothetical protein